MQRFGACLAQVSPLERRVLVLRAALGQRRVRSRAVVARITGLRLSRVARIETRGLKRLRDLGRNGGCGVGAAALPGAALPIGGVPTFAGLALLPGSISALEPRGGVLSDHASGRSKRSPADAEAALKPEASALDLGGGGGGGFSPVMLLIPLALLAYGLWAVRGERRA